MHTHTHTYTHTHMESEQQPVAAANAKMADEVDTSGASLAAKTESDALAVAGATEKKEKGKEKEDNGSKGETQGNLIRKAGEADDSSDDEPILKKKVASKDTPKKKLKYASSSGDSSSSEDECKSNFASMCWDCKQKAYSCVRCRKEKAHTGCDWRKDDRARADQQGRGAERTFKTSSGLAETPPGGGVRRGRRFPLGEFAARRPQDEDTSARRYYACCLHVVLFSLAHLLVSLSHYFQGIFFPFSIQSCIRVRGEKSSLFLPFCPISHARG